MVALGLIDRLVAVTHECDYPPSLAGLPRLTSDLIADSPGSSREIDGAVRAALADGHGLYRLDADRLADLQPDLILTQELCPVCAVAYPAVVEAARLAGGGAEPLVVSLEPRRLGDIFSTIELVAALCGVEREGAALIEALRGRLAALQPPDQRPRVAVLEWLDPLFAPGHWVPDQVAAAGGTAVFGAPGERSRETTWAALAAGRPEIVVLGLCGFDLARTISEWEAFELPGELRSTPAWRERQLWAMDGSAYVSRPGPRLVDGVEILSAVFQGRPDTRAIRLSRGHQFPVGPG